MVHRIKALALAHPAYGCHRLEAMLALEGIRFSEITIPKMLNDNGLCTKVERWLALEANTNQQAPEPRSEASHRHRGNSPREASMRLIGAELFERNDTWLTSSGNIVFEAFAKIDKQDTNSMLNITTKDAGSFRPSLQALREVTPA